MTEQASTLTSAIERLNAGITKVFNLTFSQAARPELTDQPAQAQPKGQQPAKQAAQSSPVAFPELVLTQVTPGGKAKIETKGIALAGRVNFCLKGLALEDPPVVRALRRVHQTGEIILQFTEQTHAQVARDKSVRAKVFNLNVN